MTFPRTTPAALSPSSSPDSNRAIYCAVLVAAGLLCYANSLTGAMVFDDLAHLPNISQTPCTWTAVYQTLAHGGLRGLGTLTFAINGWLGGLDPVGYHMVNIGIHLTAGLTLFGLVRRTLELPQFQASLAPRAASLAFAVALLWIVHPLQTQAVTYIIQRYEALMALFYLLTLYCVARSAQSSTSAWRWLAVLCFWLGLASKEVMLTAPLAVLVYDRVFLCRSWKAVLAARGWMYAGFALPMLVGIATVLPMIWGRAGETTVGGGVNSVTPWQYALSQPGVVLHYLWLTIWPAALCLDYEWPVARETSAIVLPGVMVLLLLSLTAWAWFRSPPLAYVATLFFVVLAPTSSVVPIKDLAFEHRMYLPLACVLILLVLAADWLFQRWKKQAPASTQRIRLVATTALLIVATLLGVRTVVRNEDYRSSITIWSSTVRVQPQNARALHNLMIELDQAERQEEACAIGEATIAYNAAHGLPTAEQHMFLGELYARYSLWPQALPHLRAGIEQSAAIADLSPANREKLAHAHINLGAALTLLERRDEAEQHLLQALEILPHSGAAQLILQQLREQAPAKRAGEGG